MLINSSVTNKINSHKTIKNKFSIYFVCRGMVNENLNLFSHHLLNLYYLAVSHI